MKLITSLFLVALAAFAAQDSSFEDRDWKLTELNGAQLPDGLKVIPHMTFAKGRVAGNAGCNQFFASYSVHGSAMKVEKIGSTMMACAPPEVEQPTLKALATVERYQVVKDALELLNKDGRIVLRFVAK
jgi:heat shock protein HslJ